MLKRYFLSMLPLLIATVNGTSQNLPVNFQVKQLSSTFWNTSEGLPYKEVPGVNLGVTSFALISTNKIAYLSNATDEIIIADQSTGKQTNKFQVLNAPRDFVYDEDRFYVLNERQIAVYDAAGKIAKTFIVPVAYLGVERMVRYNHATYLLLPSGNSLKIEFWGNTVTPEEFEGWVTTSGDFVKTSISNGNSYVVNMTMAAGEHFQKSFTTRKKVAGAYIIGTTRNRVYLDIQLFVSESPIRVERRIVAIELDKDGLKEELTSIQMPDCYYVLSNNDLQLSSTGTILNMVTAPKGVYVLSLSETTVAKGTGYPSPVAETKYHFNDHLIQTEER